mmetsp:Transcript_2908/g.3937  ORF Transcript_2908/g.3937 Transcript_2908/m.3937 type:complete len:461 (+) Transcript_2908:223-1605(+)
MATFSLFRPKLLESGSTISRSTLSCFRVNSRFKKLHENTLLSGPYSKSSVNNRIILQNTTTLFFSTKTEDEVENKAKVEPSRQQKILELLPGVGTSFLVMSGGFAGAQYLGKGLLYLQGIEGVASPVSGIPVSILLGLLIANASPIPLPKSVKPGIAFSTKPILQAGIICVGAKLSAVDLVTTGAIGLPAVACSIAAGLTFVPWFGEKMGLPPKMSSLIAAGTSICGVTAITAVSPAIKANEQETSFAIANVVAFGTLGMLMYPYLAHALLPTSHQIGMFLGLAVHDTSQVIGSALTYATVYGDEEVLKVAAVTKLSRNLFLAGVIPGLAYMTAKREGSVSTSNSLLPSAGEIKKYVPGFVIGFVGMSALRTLGDVTLDSYEAAFGLLTGEQWKTLTSTIGSEIGSHYLLGTAMAAVGLNTSASALKGVGYKPFVVGLGGALVVGATGFTTTTILGHMFL